MKNLTKVLAIALFLGNQLSESDVQAISIDHQISTNTFNSIDAQDKYD